MVSGEERLEHKINRSWLLKLAILELNLVIVYLIVDYSLILQIIGGIFVFIILLSLRRVMAPKGNVYHFDTKSSGIKDLFDLSRKYFKINRKYLIASSLGIVIALLVLSQALIMSNSYQQASFDQNLIGQDTTGYRIKVNQINDTYYDKYLTHIEENFGGWGTSQNVELINSTTYASVEFKIIIGKNYLSFENISWIDYIKPESHLLTEQVYNLLKQLPSFPGFEFNRSETWLIVPPSLYFFDNEDSYNNYSIDDFVIDDKISVLVDDPYHSSTSADKSFVNASLSVDKIWQTSIDDVKYLEKNSLNIERKFLEGAMFLPKNLEWDLFEVLEAVASSNNLTSMIWGKMSLYTNINLEIPSLEMVNAQLFIDMIIKTGTTIRNNITTLFRNLNNHIPFSPKITSPLQLLLTSYIIELNILRNMMHISSIPLILVSLYLLYFSLGLIEKRKRNITNIMKNRGTSKNQIRLIALNEIITSGFIATIVGMVLSVPLVSLLFRSSGLLEFDMPVITLLLPSIWWYKLPIIGMLIAIDFNFLSYLLIINDPLNIVSSTEPLWLRYNLDILITFLGLLYWLFIPNLELLISDNSDIIYSTIGPISLVFLVIGLPLSISRILLPLIGKILYKIPRKLELIKLAVTNLINNRVYTIQILLLLLSGIMLVSVSLVIPQTLSVWSYEQQMYDNGADIYIENISPDQTDLWNAIDVPGVIGKTEIIKFQFEPSFWQVPVGDETKQYTLLGINSSTFTTAAYWSDNFSNESITTISKSISTNTSIGMLASVANHLNLDYGDTIQLRYGQRGVYYLNYNLNATFDFFPNLVEDLPWKNSEEILQFPTVDILASYELVEHLSTIIHNPTIRGAYLKVDDNANIIKVIDELEEKFKNIYSISIHSYANGEEVLGDQSNSFLIMVMNSMFVITFLVNTSGIIYFVFITSNERKKEYGILKSLGMIRSQLAKMMVYELLIIFLLSAIFGILAGILVSYSSFQIIFNLGLVDSVLTMDLVIPVPQILLVTGILVIISFIIAIIPALVISRAKTGDVLRSI